MEPTAKPRMKRQIRFTCACCKRRRGFTRLSGRWWRWEPLCEECVALIERVRNEESTREGTKE